MPAVRPSDSDPEDFRAADLRGAEAEPGPSAWQRLCVNAVPSDALLTALEAHLDRPEVAARLEELESAEEYPAPVLEELRELGLMQAFAPTADGDESRMSVFHISCLNSITARRNTSLAVTISVNALGLLPAYVAANPEQRASIDPAVAAGTFCSLLLSEISHGSNLLGNRARAERGRLDAAGAFEPVAEGEPCTHYRINGEKDLINGATRHGLLFTFLRTRNFDIDPATIEPLAARADFTMFWLERGPGVVALPRWHTLPARGADISGARFEDLIVTASRVLGREGSGMTLAQKTLTLSRGGVGSLASGCASRARDLARAWAAKRRIYGSQPIAALGAIADHLVRIEALDRLVAAVAVRTVAFLNGMGLGAAHYTAVAKSVACSFAEEAVREGQRVFGARAMLNAYPYERLMRDVVLYGVFDGTNHVMLQELSHRLAVEARRAGDAQSVLGGDSIERLRVLYATAPRSLYETLRGRNAREVFPLELHLRALDALPGHVSAAPVAAACDLLFAMVRAADAAGVWAEDQGFRLQAAELYAYLEGLAAMLELADPDRRAALGIPPLLDGERPLDRPICQFTVDWIGRRVIAGIRELVLGAGLEDDWAGGGGGGAAALTAVEAVLADGHSAVRSACRAAL